MESLLPFGPVDDPLIIDNFSYRAVKETKCVAKVCKNICGSLLDNVEPNQTFLTVCVPCYNEDLEELLKTLLSLMENIEFMKKKARLHEDKMGSKIQKQFTNVIPVIVPIFDGMKALSPSIREWLESNFPDVLDGMDGPSEHGKTDVRVACSRWWFYCDDMLDKDTVISDKLNPALTSIPDEEILSRFTIERKDLDGTGPSGNSMRASLSKNTFSGSGNANLHNVLYFHIAPIIKRSNHRKHNSHQWFFDGICAGLEQKAELAFLTDCGTTYNPTCLGRLVYELSVKQDLIGVTARQRVEMPGLFFHPCQSAPYSWMVGDHSEGKLEPCWKCYLTYFMSPCPLQGFEFEATLIMNSAMFNLVEALPVMPGPCQLLNWQKMKEFRVVDEYFSLLFKEENDKKLPKLPRGHKSMRMDSPTSGAELTDKLATFDNPIISNSEGEEEKKEVDLEENQKDEGDEDIINGKDGSKEEGFKGGSDSKKVKFNDVDDDSDPEEEEKADENKIKNPMLEKIAALKSKNQQVGRIKSTGTSLPVKKSSLSFTEFLRVNMRLAEDRILSFVCVFSTGFGTKWIPGATFYYQPEIQWNTLLTQRRRWLNGTFASFLFFFKSKRARTRISGGMFDSHKAAKNIRFVDALWSLQLLQLILVFMAPAVFGSVSYTSLIDSARLWPEGFGWANTQIVGIITVAELWVFLYLTIYAVWTINGFYAPRGKVSEQICQLVAVTGFIFVFPVYFAVWFDIFSVGTFDFVDVIVICSLILPVFIAIAQSSTSAALYVAYLPWFLFLILFFLVFIPSYSFARLWDTTWGNRATGADSAITDNILDIMKTRNFIFIVSLIGFNIFLVYALVTIFRVGYSYVLGFMLIVFFPSIVQLVCSFLFLFIVVPLRGCWTPRAKENDTITELPTAYMNPSLSERTSYKA